MICHSYGRSGAGKGFIMSNIGNNVTIIPAEKKIYSGRTDSSKLRAAAYVRVSTMSDEQEDSFENQKLHYEEIVSNDPHYELVNIYADQASGLNTKKRLQFNSMMRDAKNHKFDVLFVKSISRFARNTITTLTAIRELNSYGIETRFEKENISSKDPSINIMLSLMASMAESESMSISENVNLGLKYKYSRGEWSANFTHFLGYDKLPDGTVVVNEEQAATVKEIYNEFLSGMSLEHLVEKLEAEGRQTGKGNTTWTKTGLLRILSNIKYSGDVIQGITTTVDVINKKRVINNGEAPQYFIEGGIPAIVDKQTYLLAKGELARREKMTIEGKDVAGPLIYTGKYPLSKKILCPHCGQYYNHRNARGVDVWECYGRIHDNCQAEILRQEELYAVIHTALQMLRDLHPTVKMNKIPVLLKDDPEDKHIEAAGLYLENAFARKTQEFLNGSRPEDDDPEYTKGCGDLIKELLEKIELVDNVFLVKFYGVAPVRVGRMSKARNVYTGKRLTRSR